LLTRHGSFVAGPPLVTPSSYDKIIISNRLIPDVYLGKPFAKSGLPGGFDAYVDIRDVARLVVFGIEHPDKADGERFLAAPYYAPAQAVADLIRKEYPGQKDVVEEGTPGEGYSPDYSFPEVRGYDSSKAVRVTGQQFIPFEQTVVDTVEKLKPILQ